MSTSIQLRKLPDGRLQARRVDGCPMTPEDREEAKRLAAETAADSSDLTEGRIKAIRGQRTEWRDLTIDDSTTGILICSTVLGADIWLALRDDFDPDPDLPSFAIYYIEELPLLRTKTIEQLREIHKVKLTFGPRSMVRQ